MPSANPSPTAKPFSISFGTSKPKPSPAAAPKKRPHTALADHSDDEDERPPTPQLVSAFDQTGAITTNGRNPAKAPLVIQAEKNRDWREESRKKRRKNLLPAEVQAQRSGQAEGANPDQAHVERDEVSKVSGITFVSRDLDRDVMMSDGRDPHDVPEKVAPPPKTADEEAMEALITGEKKSTLVLPALDPDDRDGHDLNGSTYVEYANEDSRFKADVASRPDVATLDDYARVPVDEFGKGILRGLGWTEGGNIGKRDYGTATTSKVVERRPALLGIGAKEVPSGVGDEPGAWGKAVKGKRKTDLTYNPVLLKNSKTGEMLTEEELEAKKADQKKEKEELDWRERRDKNLVSDERRKGWRKEKERLALEDGRRHESRRDRTRSRERSRRDRSREKSDLDNGRQSSSKRDRSRSTEKRRRERSRERERSGHGSSRRHSRSRERDRHHGSSRRERSPNRSSRLERSRDDEGRHRR